MGEHAAIEARLARLIGGAPLQRPVYATDDPAVAERQGGRVLSPHRLRAGSGFGARFYDAPVGGTTLLGASYVGEPAVIGTAPTTHWNLSVVLDGALTVTDDDGEAAGGRGWLLVTPPTGLVRVRFAAETALVGMRVPAQVLDRRLAVLNGRPVRMPLSLARALPPSTATEAILAALREALTVADGTPLLSAALALAVEESLLTTVLLRVPGSHTEELLRPGDAVATPAARRAAEIMRETGPDCPPLPELAARVGVSLRRLQAGFQATFGTTPTRYLRDLRLDEVHRTLRAADRRRTTVAAAATAAGFTHLGRFSGDYRERFGEEPSATLRAEG